MACFRHQEIPNTMLMNDGLRKIRAVFRVPSRGKMVSHSHAIYYIDKFYHQKLMHCDALGWYWGRRSRLLILFNLTVFSLNPLKEREKRDLCRFNLPSLNTKVIATRKLECWKCFDSVLTLMKQFNFISMLFLLCCLYLKFTRLTLVISFTSFVILIKPGFIP